MGKEVWKWILKGYSDKELLQLIYDINEYANISKTKKIEIRGISDFSKMKTIQMNLFRARVESEMNKTVNTNKLKKILRNKIENHNNYKDFLEFKEKDFDVIYKEISENENFSIRDIIIYLMIQTDNAQNEKAILVYDLYTQENTNQNKKNEIETSMDEKEDDQQNLMIEIEKLQKCITFEKKITQNLNDDAKLLEKDILKLKKENNDLSKDYKKLKIELSEKKEAIYILDQKNKDQKKIIENLEKTIKSNSIVLKEQRNYIEKIEEKLIDIEEIKYKNKIKIYYIGKSLPIMIKNFELINVSLIAPNEIDKIVIDTKFYEIWFIKFRLHKIIQNKLIDIYGKKVFGFDSEKELKEYISVF